MLLRGLVRREMAAIGLSPMGGLLFPLRGEVTMIVLFILLICQFYNTRDDILLLHTILLSIVE